MGSAYHDHLRTSRFRRFDACRRIFEGKTIFDALTEHFRSEQKAVRGRFTIPHILAGDQKRRCTEARSLETDKRQRSWCGCYDGPSASRQRVEKIAGTRNRFNAHYVGNFRHREKPHFFCWFDACEAKPRDRFDRLSSVDHRQQGLDIDAVPQRPLRPNSFGYRDRIQNGSVHIEQEGTKGLVVI